MWCNLYLQLTRISIHLMFLLIFSCNKQKNSWKDISIHLMFLLIFGQAGDLETEKTHFNTSHVSINPVVKVESDQRVAHFNTSHVSINQKRGGCWMRLAKNFNTSHVSINRNWIRKSRSRSIISIHLMFLLITVYNSFGGAVD